MRVVVIGATGNVGTALVQALTADPAVTEVVAVARRLPSAPQPDGRGSISDPASDGASRGAAAVSWHAADIARDNLDPLMSGADAVVTLAWLFQPTHRAEVTWANNVLGTNRVMEAVARNGVGTFVHTSSVAAYSPRTSDEPIDETWPTHGASSAAYAREKAYVERLVDLFELRTTGCRVVRFRPGFIFQRRAASQQRRLFAGPLVPGSLMRPELVPVLPVPRGLLLQTVHADDVAQAFRAAIVSDVSGAFNVCADDILKASDLAEMVNARVAPVPPRLARTALALAWRAYAVPAAPELLDALLVVPMMTNTRAKEELGWAPRVSATDAPAEFFEGLRAGVGYATPPLDPRSSGPLRFREFTSGVGTRP